MSSTRASIRLTTDDGIFLAANLSATARPPRGTVVVCHGFTATRNNPHVLELDDVLTASGFSVLTYDARGHGESGGSCTLGDDEWRDVASAVAAARDVAGPVAGPVVAVGASMGAIAALRYAASDPTLDGVVAVSCPARWRLHSPQSAVGALMTRTRPGRFVIRRRIGVRVSPHWASPIAPEDLIGEIRGPVAVVHGRADRLIPVREALRLHARAGLDQRLDLVPRMGHAFGPRAVRPVIAAVEWAVASAVIPATA